MSYRMLRRTAFALALSAASSAHAGALLDLYGQAQANDKTLLGASYQRDAALESRPQALAALLPQVNGQGTYTVQESNSSYSTSRFGSPMPQTITQKSESDDRTLSLSLSQAIFDWAAFTRLKQSDSQMALAETAYQAARQDLILRTAQAYFNVLTAAETLRAAEAQKSAIGRQLEQSKQRFEVGLSAITDVQDAQARADLAIAQQLQADFALSAARRALAQITGAAENKVVAVREDLPLSGPDPLNPQVWTDAAREANLAVLAAQLTKTIADADVKIARSRHLPTLGVQAGYSDSKGDNTTDGNQSPTKSDGSQIQAILTLPIYAGGAVQSGVRAARASQGQRLAEYENTVRSAERSAGDAYQGVITGISSVKAFKASVTSTRTALEASEVGLQVGTRTAIDVLNAQQLLYAAESSYAQSRYNYLYSVLQLKAAAGRLTEADLAEIDRLLISE
ncbi:MAG: TolC family outer membrane protein [Pseudomonadota bacterium]